MIRRKATDMDKLKKSIIIAKAMGWSVKPYSNDTASWGIWTHIKGDLYNLRSSNVFVGVYDSSNVRVSKGDQPHDDDDLEKHWKVCPNFYSEKDMKYAWRAIKWGLAVKDTDPPGSMHSFYRFHNRFSIWLSRRQDLWGRSNAMELILNKIVGLILEDGLVDA